MTRDLFALMTWLESEGVTHIAMESTGIYWKPVYNILEGYFDIALANAQRIKNVPGRKTDVSDAEWIAKSLRVGLIEKLCACRRPSGASGLDAATQETSWQFDSREESDSKMLEASNVKLGTVISDVFGVSGRNLLARLMEQGYVDADDIEHRVHGNVKRNVKRVAESLFGTLNTHQMLMIRNCWEHIAFLEQSIAALDAEIEAHLKPYQEAQVLIQTIPGVSDVTAPPSSPKLVSTWSSFQQRLIWPLGQALPLETTRALAKKYTHTQRKSTCKTALCAKMGRNEMPKIWPVGSFWKLAARRGKKKAIIALARKILTIIYMMLKTKIAYVEGGPESARPVA